MSDSLRDQLLKSGIVKQVAPSAPPAGKARDGRLRGGRPLDERRDAPVQPGKSPPGQRPHKPPPPRPPRPGHSRADIDLARAYAMRAQSEAGERKRAEQQAAEQARLRRESKLKIQQLLSGNALNKAEADQPRNFEYGGKIRRVHVDAAQLVALNAGELGVVQQAGRYLLVTRELAEQIRAIDPRQLALLVDPGAAVADDGVPDDLMW